MRSGLRVPSLIALTMLSALMILMMGFEPHSRVPGDLNRPSMDPVSVRKSLNAFGFDLFSNLNYWDRNTVFSPFSVFSALAMAYEGARGVTADEMASVLHLHGKSPARGYSSILEGLSGVRGLKVANALWVQRGFPLREEFLRLISEQYSGRADSIDFVGDPEGSRRIINEFIRERTGGEIGDLLPEGAINELTRLVITNAVHFKGTWRYRFDPSETFEGEFRTPQGGVRVQMMRLLPEVPFNYSDTGECEVLELPHEGRTSMLIFLPKGNGRPDISLEDAERAMKSMREVRLDEIIIPKFEITSEYDLNGLLMRMGIRSAFSPDRADFSGMYRREEAIGNLYVSLVRHKARIALDEEGTEAAGATGVVVGITAARERRAFVADHPFAFLIVDRETGTIFFMGSVVNPASG